MRRRMFVLGWLAAAVPLAACQPPQPLTEEAFQPIEINKTVWVVPGNNAFVIDAAREARQDFRSTLAIEVREADDENQMGVIFSQYVNRPVETFGNPSGAVQRFDRGLPPSVAGAFTEEAHKREITMAGGSVVSTRSFERGRETTYRDRNGDTCVMVGNGRLRDASQGEAGGYDFVNHAVLCGAADTRSAFVTYVRGGSIAPRVARVDGDPKELKLPSLPNLPKFPCLRVVCK
jgi:hypothetical protein